MGAITASIRSTPSMIPRDGDSIVLPVLLSLLPFCSRSWDVSFRGTIRVTDRN